MSTISKQSTISNALINNVQTNLKLSRKEKRREKLGLTTPLSNAAPKAGQNSSLRGIGSEKVADIKRLLSYNY